jgi:hypothetical protein
LSIPHKILTAHLQNRSPNQYTLRVNILLSFEVSVLTTVFLNEAFCRIHFSCVEMLRWYLKLGHYRFFSRPFQFKFCWSSYFSRLYNLIYWKHYYINRKWKRNLNFSLKCVFCLWHRIPGVTGKGGALQAQYKHPTLHLYIVVRYCAIHSGFWSHLSEKLSSKQGFEPVKFSACHHNPCL